MTEPVFRALGRAIVAALLAASLGAVCTALFYAWHPALRMEFDRDPPRLVTGIYPSERDPKATLTFAWTGPEATLRIPGLDRRVEWTLALRVRGGRPVPADNPAISIFADGLLLATQDSTAEFQNISVTIPAHPEQRRGIVIAIHSSKTFVPGPSDRRALGVMLDDLVLTPGGAVLPPPAALGGAALASGFMGAAIAGLGVTTGSAVVGAILAGAGIAAIIARGFGPFTAFPSTAARTSLAVAAALVILALAVQQWRRAPLRNTARFAAAFSAAALLLKLLVLLHPDMPIGDALFHAHRFQAVLGGNLFFTSIAPGGYAFPYAPGFYVLAAPFARFVHGSTSHMALLRIIASSADAVAGVLLYGAIERAWKDRLAAAIAVAIYQLTPLDFDVMRAGNLTNAFAQSLAVVCFVMMSAGTLRLERRSVWVAFAVLLTAAYLSHTSTLAILFVATLAIAVLFRAAGGPVLRSPAAAILIATLAAAALAVAAYYAHFLQTYQSEFARLSRETVAAAPDAGGRGVLTRFDSIPYYVRLYFGSPIVLLTAIGAWRMFARGAADRLTLAVAGWMLSCFIFLVVGIVTPVDMRYYLAAIPAVAVVSAIGASRGWQTGGWWRVATAVLLAGTAVVGIRNWWGALG
jgi:hypothetical protein